MNGLVPGLVIDLGLIEYGAAWELQLSLIKRRLAGEVPDLLLLCEHPDVITVGRRQRALANILSSRFPVHEVERGGDVTYHGPGQLVGYPILLLNGEERDLHRYLRNLEEGLIKVCAACGVRAGRKEGFTGVWTQGQDDGEEGQSSSRKLASIGIAVRRWITFHGFALNVTTDLTRFSAINPCGLEARVMASLDSVGATLHGARVTVASLRDLVTDYLGAALSRRLMAGSLTESGVVLPGP